MSQYDDDNEDEVEELNIKGGPLVFRDALIGNKMGNTAILLFKDRDGDYFVEYGKISGDSSDWEVGDS